MVQHIERSYGSVGTQGRTESQRRSSEPVRPPKQTKSTWFNTHPLGPEHRQQALEQDTNTSDGEDVPSALLQAAPEAQMYATIASSCTGEVEAKGEQSCEAVKVEHQSFNNASSTQERCHPVGLSPSRLEICSTSAGTGPSGIYLPSHRRPVRIKAETGSPQAPNLEIPQRHLSYAHRKYRPPIRVPSPEAEQFYRSVTREPQERDKLPDGKKALNINQQSTQQMSDHETPQRDVKVKLQPSSHEYYMPTGASDGNFSTQVVSSRNAHVRDSASLPSDGVEHRLTESISTLDLNASGQRHSIASPTSRPGTGFSYLKPLTPTPFSTPYGFVNPSPYAANLHLVSGSLLEGMRRRTKWGDRGKLPKQITLMTQARHEPQVERLCEVDSKTENEDEEREHETKTCAWYKLLFCKCCTIAAIPQSSNASPLLPHVESAVVLRDEKTARRQIRDAPLPCTVMPASKEIRKRKWWQLRRRQVLTNDELKTRLRKRSAHGGPEGERVPQLNLRRRNDGVGRTRITLARNV
jgi:hypothetical protein